jgi:hypothetical protein
MHVAVAGKNKPATVHCKPVDLHKSAGKPDRTAQKEAHPGLPLKLKLKAKATQPP